jgi:hypothetical protein
VNIVYALGLATICSLRGAPWHSDAGKTQGAIRNPQQLRAVQLLDQRAPDAARRVRFEWDQVPGALQYVLSGQWTTPTSWTLRSREYRVSPRSATRWKREQVWFEIPLPVGAHSWRVIAIFGPNDVGDFARPTQLSFDVR